MEIFKVATAESGWGTPAELGLMLSHRQKERLKLRMAMLTLLEHFGLANQAVRAPVAKEMPQA